MTKDEAAQFVADLYFGLDQGTLRLFRVVGPDEGDSSKPVKLLEVNDITPEMGIMPVGIPADPSTGLDYSVIVMEISPSEFDRLKRGELSLPHAWTVDKELSATTHAIGATT